MPFARDILSKRIIQAALDLIEEHKLRLCDMIESKRTSPDDTYEALIWLASRTGF